MFIFKKKKKKMSNGDSNSFLALGYCLFSTAFSTGSIPYSIYFTSAATAGRSNDLIGSVLLVSEAAGDIIGCCC